MLLKDRGKVMESLLDLSPVQTFSRPQNENRTNPELQSALRQWGRSGRLVIRSIAV